MYRATVFPSRIQGASKLRNRISRSFFLESCSNYRKVRTQCFATSTVQEGEMDSRLLSKSYTKGLLSLFSETFVILRNGVLMLLLIIFTIILLVFTCHINKTWRYWVRCTQCNAWCIFNVIVLKRCRLGVVHDNVFKDKILHRCVRVCDQYTG